MGGVTITTKTPRHEGHKDVGVGESRPPDTSGITPAQREAFRIADTWWRGLGIVYGGVDLGEALTYDLFQLIAREL